MCEKNEDGTVASISAGCAVDGNRKYRESVAVEVDGQPEEAWGQLLHLWYE